MAKLELDPVGSLENQTSAIQVLNENFGRIEDALENTLSRNGAGPNQLSANLDFNGNRGTNLGTPIAGTDAARLIDLQDVVGVSVLVVPSLAGNSNKVLSTDNSVLVFKDPATFAGVGDMKLVNALAGINQTTARTNLGLGTMAVEAASDYGKMNVNITRTGGLTQTGQLVLNGVADHVLISSPDNLSDGSLGYRGIPQETKDVAYTFVLGDSGKSKLHTSATAHIYTVPNNATVLYPIGTILIVDNTGTGAVTINRGVGVVLRIAGLATDQNIAVAQWGSVYLRKIGTNTWVASGVNIS